MAEELYPTFDMPEINIGFQASKNKYKQSVFFDFSTGDFPRDGAHRIIAADGREAYRQWCIMAISTERYDHLAYSPSFGAEIDAAMKEPDIGAVQSAVMRTITETLKTNPHTEYVNNFEFTQSADELRVSFTVKGYNLDELIKLGVAIST